MSINYLGLAASVAATLGVYALSLLLRVIHKELTSPLRNVPGPKSAHWFLGDHLQLFKIVENGQEGVWNAQYGRTVRINDFMGFSMLWTSDTKALQHILSNSYVYQKPEMGRYFLGRVVGPGVLVVEEDMHKKQNPAFGPAQVRALTGIFVEKSKQLRDLWASRATQSNGAARVNVIPDFSTATLDIIGQAGFNYNFNSLGVDHTGARDELHEAFATISAAGDRQNALVDTLKGVIPPLRTLKIDKVIDNSHAVMRRIGLGLLRDSRQKIAEGHSADSAGSRDLLSLLVRANMSKDIPESQRLSEEDVLAQVPTFLVAGHEVPSWALYAIAENPEVQTRLRNELLAVDNDNPTMEDLNALPYLDCVVRETLRAHSPVIASLRMATRDDVIPLETPYTDRNGTVHETLKRGQRILLPILALNRDPDVWGPDAHQFIPERWERRPTLSTSIPGVWSHMMTFIGGPRACIGYRFSLVELKALLFTLVRGLEFELALPAAQIGRLPTAIVQQPFVRGEREAGSQMPLLIKPFIQS
ncbi:cytochrome P450 [Mycena albidolilacea]|uniref:Cytochrome P450 n=1 Tax=Mycena albidolilacea TaxID=1033008 RepID=A0AAD7F3F1_9AGAR|nr:cytochrome P450 [Mycena albidolilacea]